MRLSRVVSVALGALATAALTVFPSGFSQAAVAEYVAMGDSYASGTGAGNYTDVACTRSANAYPALWAAANRPGAFKFVACGGAQIPDVRSGQLSALTANTGLVSISIGGNDSGFASTMLRCKYLTTTSCQRAVEDARGYVEGQLPSDLASLYGEIRSRAPRAKVVVLGYPYLYETGGYCSEMNATKRQILKDGADTLNNVIAAAARNAGFAFADARPAFAGHSICAAQEWIDPGNVHPNAAGHAQGYLPILTAAAGS
ncbi:SGNH/GDSL hydrolase family protein [Thermomonospora amylolytica]|uniref:SGNH/GDSL hydrolase family protein n=1 Tax=Thermomonospora amylolytica TaxID=1411117 RepID=UPI000E6C8E47|nr:SGNH/GDSL hydrolase family protein [Thermomonospora amylolytica]